MKRIDSTTDTMLDDLQKELQLEMQKSFKKRDYHKIAELYSFCYLVKFLLQI